MRLFLSYSRKDREKVDELAAILRDGGQEVWIDDALRTGERWRDALHTAIDSADGIVLAITPDWMASPWCQWEFITAAELGKKVIPVLLTKTDLPERISQYQYADFVEGFMDAERVQRFLDDLLLLAADIKVGESDISKAELERRIEQAIQMGDVSESAVDARQRVEAGSAADQRVQMGNISGSTITINQENVQVGKTRNWTVPVILTLFFTFILAVAAVIALLPDTERNNLLYGVGMIGASPTPTATATATLTLTATFTPSPTPEPTFTPTPTPVRLPAGQFNVVVAGFGFRNPDGEVVRSTLADDMSDIVTAELSQITQIDNTLGWRVNGVGHILGETPAEREAQAAAIAELLNADVVIYGIVSSDSIFNRFEPEFYITAEFAALEPELIGADTLGNPLEFVGNSDDEILAANSFRRRVGVMRFFLRGLAFYLAGNFDGSRTSFDEALAIESDGLEVLYIFAGNAAVRIPDADAALGYYDAALRQRPGYARALVGRGIALYRRALDAAGDNPPPYDPTLSLPDGQTCADVDAPLPESPQLLGQLALRCYIEAGESSDQPETADIDVKVAFGIGQTSLWLSINRYDDLWDDVLNELSLVIALYDESPDARQARIRAATAHAHAWLGLRLLSIDGNNVESGCEAYNNYRVATALLRTDVNREYNQRWIDLYGQQVAALEDWLAGRNYDCDES